MRTRALLWRRRAMFCASSSGKRCWEFRYFEEFAENGCAPARTDKCFVKTADKEPWRSMSKTIWLGAVAYHPKVVAIWEGMRSYFHEEAHLPVEVVLFQSYEAQVTALLAQPGEPVPRIDIAWNTNLAYLQADEWSGHAC